jgi:hypothetical protein
VGPPLYKMDDVGMPLKHLVRRKNTRKVEKKSAHQAVALFFFCVR